MSHTIMNINQLQPRHIKTLENDDIHFFKICIVDIFINRATDPEKNMFHWNAEIGLCFYISIQDILM